MKSRILMSAHHASDSFICYWHYFILHRLYTTVFVKSGDIYQTAALSVETHAFLTLSCRIFMRKQIPAQIIK